MRRCFLHVGTHKTATTSIQHFLNDQGPKLAACGWSYPRIGRPDGANVGHHNLAWEISNDRRFRADRGTIATLIHEIAKTDHHVILSSEDFECSAHHGEKFGEFIAAIQRLGIELSLIVYLRNQVDYAESLYCTLLHQGFERPFSEFCDEILASGEIRWREWIFPFHYERFVALLAGFAEVIVRSYDDPARGSPVLNFLRAVGIDGAGLSSDELPHENRRPELRESFHRYWTNQGRPPPAESELEAIAITSGLSGGGWPSMSLTRRAGFATAFGESNLRLCEKYDLPPLDLRSPGKLVAATSWSLDDIFRPEFRPA